MDNFLIREANHASRTHNPQQVTCYLGPVPGAHKTKSKPYIDQIKGGIRKLKEAQRIHDVKLDAIVNVMCSSLLTSILDHMRVNVDTHQQHLRKGPGGFNNPATCSAGNIQHAPKNARIILLCQDSAHRCCHKPILIGQAKEFFHILSVLNKVCTGIVLILLVPGRRHRVTLLRVCKVFDLARALLYSALLKRLINNYRYYIPIVLICLSPDRLSHSMEKRSTTFPQEVYLSTISSLKSSEPMSHHKSDTLNLGTPIGVGPLLKCRDRPCACPGWWGGGGW